MKNMVGAASMAALLLIVPACSQQAPPSGSDAFSAQDRNFLKVIGQSTMAEVALGKLAAQKGTTPAVRLFKLR